MKRRAVKAKIWEPRIRRNVTSRPILSESPPQKKRPIPLNRELMAIRVAPAAAKAACAAVGSMLEKLLVLRNKSWSIGDCSPMNMMPAQILAKKNNQMTRKRSEKMQSMADSE